MHVRMYGHRAIAPLMQGYAQLYLHYCTIHVKKNATICKICAPLFGRNMRRTCYGLPLDCAGSTVIPNCGTFCQMCHIFTAKGAARLRRFTRRHTAVRLSKCSAHGGRKAVHMVPCFQVPLRCACCTLFVAYHTRTHRD